MNEQLLAQAIRTEHLIEVKGGAGQGLQCLNLMLGFPETSGLPRSGLGVC